MAICPQCKNEHSRRAKGGVCPTCGTEITIHKSMWFSTDGENPAMILLNDYERLYAVWLSQGQDVLPWYVPKRHIARELSQASRIIHEICGGDLVLARRSLEILFTDRRWAYRNYSTLLFAISDIHSTRIVAQRELAVEKERVEQSKDTQDRQAWRQEILNL